MLDRGPFCETTGTLCFGLQMTLSMSFKVRVDSSSPMLFCCLCTTIPGATFGCWDCTSNPAHSAARRTNTRPAQYHIHLSTKSDLGKKIEDKLGIILSPSIQKLHVNRMLIVNQLKGPEIQIGLQLELVVNN